MGIVESAKDQAGNRVWRKPLAHTKRYPSDSEFAEAAQEFLREKVPKNGQNSPIRS